MASTGYISVSNNKTKLLVHYIGSCIPTAFLLVDVVRSGRCIQ